MKHLVAVLGAEHHAVNAAVSWAMARRRDRIVVDGTGRGALLLDEETAHRTPSGPVYWYDLANRQRAAGLFVLDASLADAEVLTRGLEGMARVLQAPLSHAEAAWAATSWVTLAHHGHAGPAALCRSLADLELRAHVLSEQPDGGTTRSLVHVLRTALMFPSVYAHSESAAVPEHRWFGDGRGQTVWFEAWAEHFERTEHRVLLQLLDTMLELHVRRFMDGPALRGLPPVVLHLHSQWPGTDEVAPWIGASADRIHHVGTFALHGDRPLSPVARAWAETASSVVVVGPVAGLSAQAHADWLSAPELERIAALRPGEAWVRDATTRKGVITHFRAAPPPRRPAHQFRRVTARKLGPVRADQIASVFAPTSDAPARGDLYRHLCNQDFLRLAWLRIRPRGSRNSATIRQDFEDFAARVDDELRQLTRELTEHTYAPRPTVRFWLERPDKEPRPLAVVSVRDRVVQQAVLMLLEPLFEPTFNRNSFAFRPRRGAQQAVAVARGMISAGRTWAVRTDIRRCFESLDHGLLRARLSATVADQDILALLDAWISTEVLERGHLLPAVEGVQQGAVLSPMLANIYLTPLDLFLEGRGLDFIRYADDIIVLVGGQDQAEATLTAVEGFLNKRLKLELKHAKTVVRPVRDGVEFLGFELWDDGIAVAASRLDRATDTLRSAIEDIANASEGPLSQGLAFAYLDAFVRGFRTYFELPGEPRLQADMVGLDAKVDAIAARILPLRLQATAEWTTRARFAERALPEALEMVHRVEPYAALSEPTPRDTPPELERRPSADRASQPITGATPRGRALSRPTAAVTGDDAHDGLPPEAIAWETDHRLFVLANGTWATCGKDQTIRLRHRRKVVGEYKLEGLHIVFFHGYGMGLSADLHLRLAAAGTQVVIASPTSQIPVISGSAATRRSRLRAAQVLRRDTPEAMRLAADLLSAKMGNQAAVLRYFARYRSKVDPPAARSLTEAADAIKALIPVMLARAPELDAAQARPVLMGYEGRAAAQYWQALTILLSGPLGYEGRHTQGARDVVNQSLNYLYGILYAEVWQAVVTANLDPHFGVLHGTDRDEGSLIFDVIEEFRAPFVDRLLLGMIGRGFMPSADRHGRLSTSTRRKLVRAFLKGWARTQPWRSRRCSGAEILTSQVRDLARFFQDEGRYRPFRMKW